MSLKLAMVNNLKDTQRHTHTEIYTASVYASLYLYFGICDCYALLIYLVVCVDPFLCMVG